MARKTAKGGSIGGKAYRDKQEALKKSIPLNSMRMGINASLRIILEGNAKSVKDWIGGKFDEEMIRDLVADEVSGELNKLVSSQ